jgi:hypothetical protein
MSVMAPIKVETDGLVLNADFYNPKGYAGPNLPNIINQISMTSGTGNGYSFVSGTEAMYIPKLYTTVNSKYVDIQNNYPAVSTLCCPNVTSYGDVTVSGSTTYTYAILYRSANGYTNGNYMYRYEYNSGTYLTEAGVFTTAQRIDMGNGWFWAWNTFTTQATTNRLVLYSFYYQYSTTFNRFHVANIMVIKGNFTGLSPEFWPPINSARSDTGCVFDLAGSNSFNVANVSYNTSGYPTFNGSNSYIISPENSALNTQTPSVEVWVKTNATSQQGFFFEKGQVNTQYSLFQENASIVWRQSLSSGVTSQTVATSTYISTSNWAQIVGTYTSGQRRLYINGVLVNSDTQAGTVNTNTNGSSIGVYGGFNGSRSYYYNGLIGSVKVYNKVLTPSEVRNNYDAMRGRFGA